MLTTVSHHQAHCGCTLVDHLRSADVACAQDSPKYFATGRPGFTSIVGLVGMTSPFSFCFAALGVADAEEVSTLARKSRQTALLSAANS